VQAGARLPWGGRPRHLHVHAETPGFLQPAGGQGGVQPAPAAACQVRALARPLLQRGALAGPRYLACGARWAECLNRYCMPTQNAHASAMVTASWRAARLRTAAGGGAGGPLSRPAARSCAAAALAASVTVILFWRRLNSPMAAVAGALALGLGAPVTRACMRQCVRSLPAWGATAGTATPARPATHLGMTTAVCRELPESRARARQGAPDRGPHQTGAGQLTVGLQAR
jgi:hypothetical protein